MKFYLAPMEGLTGFVFRNAYQKHFGNIDTYFTPFINNKKMNYKEIKDILPEHNEGMHVVPQILTNRAEDFLAIAKELGNYGYESVNLNLGCPSGTVVAKHRGAGFLAVPEELDHFLEEIFAECPLRISVKTRVGVNDAGEWEHLLSIYEKYPMEELIIHPRVQKDFYMRWKTADIRYVTTVTSAPWRITGHGDSRWKRKGNVLLCRNPGIRRIRRTLAAWCPISCLEEEF